MDHNAGVLLAQLTAQLRSHRHGRYEVDLKLVDEKVLKGFVVHPGVMRPEKMTSRILASWLSEKTSIYDGKTVLDMGSGTGVQGIVMGLNGADTVIFSDLSAAAHENTMENVKKYGLDESNVYTGDLFEKIEGKSDLIVFNHPFFTDKTLEELLSSKDLSKDIMSRGTLIRRFLSKAKKHLTKDGLIIMPYYHLAGQANDPGIQAVKLGYDVSEKIRIYTDIGLQKGKISIYLLKPI